MGPIYADKPRKNKKITPGCKKRLLQDVFEVYGEEARGKSSW